MDNHLSFMAKGNNEVNFIENMLKIQDNGGRRIGIERRFYTYTGHIPERRTGVDRRIKVDRRIITQGIITGNELLIIERRKAYN